MMMMRHAAYITGVGVGLQRRRGYGPGRIDLLYARVNVIERSIGKDLIPRLPQLEQSFSIGLINLFRISGL
jgi:hypothetical protein